MARLGDKDKLPEVHRRIAMQLEEEGRLEEAAEHFVEAGRAEEAVAIFIHDQQWAQAEKVAKYCDRGMRKDEGIALQGTCTEYACGCLHC